MRFLSALLAAPLLLAVTSSCRPKGSDKPATIETTTTNNFVIRHPNFEGHLDPTVTKEGTKFPLRLVYSGMPEKSSIAVEGKPVPLKRSGDIPTSIDLGAAIGDDSVQGLGRSLRLPTPLPFELSFFGDRQKVSSTVAVVNVWLEARSCMSHPPCPFPNDGPPSAKPNILYFEKGESLSQKVVGTPSKVRDIDWIALTSAAPEVDGKKCRMEKIPMTTGGAPTYADEHTLKREAATVTIHDRRSGAKLHTKTFTGPDRCPRFAEIKMTGDKSGLRSPVEASDVELWFQELRGEASPSATAAPTPQPASPKAKKPAKK